MTEEQVKPILLCKVLFIIKEHQHLWGCQQDPSTWPTIKKKKYLFCHFVKSLLNISFFPFTIHNNKYSFAKHTVLCKSLWPPYFFSINLAIDIWFYKFWIIESVQNYLKIVSMAAKKVTYYITEHFSDKKKRVLNFTAEKAVHVAVKVSRRNVADSPRCSVKCSASFHISL